MEPQAPIFVDAQTLLQSSLPKPSTTRLVYGLVLAALVLLLLTIQAGRDSAARQSYETLWSLGMVLVLGCTTLIALFQAREARREQARLEAAEELVQLRRWKQAAVLLQAHLSRPNRSPIGRLQALVYFTGVLSRFGQFDEALTIADDLLRSVPPDAPVVHLIKLARATALLRQDRLVDADRAISDLRHMREASESSGLALLEMFRDVVTGHPTEALQTFGEKRDLIRRQLGHRVADAHFLAAAAHDLLGQSEQAQKELATATLLAPVKELRRRYPEMAKMTDKYAATPAPRMEGESLSAEVRA